MPFDDLPKAAKIDYILLDNHIKHAQRQLEHRAEARQDVSPLVPFLGTIAELEVARRRYEFVAGQDAAEKLEKLAEEVTDIHAEWKNKLEDAEDDERPNKTSGRQAALAIGDSQRTLREWYEF